MGKNEEAYFELEQIISELKQGENQSAATAVLGKSRIAPNLSRSLAKLVFKFWGGKILVYVLVIALFITGALWIFSGGMAKKDTTVFVEQVHELSTLATAEAHVKVILEQEDNVLFGKEISMNLPGTKRELLHVVPATVIAGVDWRASLQRI